MVLRGILLWPAVAALEHQTFEWTYGLLYPHNKVWGLKLQNWKAKRIDQKCFCSNLKALKQRVHLAAPEIHFSLFCPILGTSSYSKVLFRGNLDGLSLGEWTQL